MDGFRAAAPLRPLGVNIFNVSWFLLTLRIFIALINYYFNALKKATPRLDYKKMPHELIKKLPVAGYVVKTVVCAPKPDDFLMGIESKKNTYNWINGLKNMDYFSVIEGEHIARPVAGFTKSTMKSDNPGSYYVVEKSTDINMATEIISKAYLNAYDTAVIISGDSDYIPVLRILSTVGKSSVMVGIKGQNLSRVKQHVDQIIILNEDFFDTCLRA